LRGQLVTHPTIRRFHPRLGAALLALLIGLCVPAAAQAASYDGFNANTLNPLDAGGQEVPYTYATQVGAQYNSSGFTLQTGEGNGCPVPVDQVTYGALSGWVRFLPRVNGKVSITVNSTGYDVMATLWSGQLALGAPPGFDALTNVTCSAPASPSNGFTIGPQAVQAGVPVFIQTLSECGTVPTGTPAPTGCADPSTATGGPTSVLVSFVPDDRDGDGVPDSIDACPDTVGSQPNGCPPAAPAPPPTHTNTPATPTDTDGDGVRDTHDKCPTVFGTGPDGCPAPVKLQWSIVARWNSLATTFSTLKLRSPVGSQIALTCSGRSCPRGLPLRFAATKTVTDLIPRLRRGRFRKGSHVQIPVRTKLTALVTNRGSYAKRLVIVPQPGKAPKVSETCQSKSGKWGNCP
jgi:Thrombospondin type 3 repeat